MLIDPAVIAAFWSNVDKSGDCWLWTGKVSNDGYGLFSKIRGIQSAHRASYVIEHGSIPWLASICHHCDVKICTRPAHLYAGDARTNITDAIMRGQRVYTGIWHRHPVQLTQERWETAIAFSEFRKTNGLTREAAASALDIYPAELSRLEQGMVAASAERWTALARLTRRTRAELIASVPPFPS